MRYTCIKICTLDFAELLKYFSFGNLYFIHVFKVLFGKSVQFSTPGSFVWHLLTWVQSRGAGNAKVDMLAGAGELILPENLGQ